MDEERKGLGCDYDKRIISVVIWFTVELSKDDFTLATRIIWLSSFFVAVTLYRGIHDMSHKSWNIVSSERYENGYSFQRCVARNKYM
jgi:hypothetical protein